MLAESPIKAKLITIPCGWMRWIIWTAVHRKPSSSIQSSFVDIWHQVISNLKWSFELMKLVLSFTAVIRFCSLKAMASFIEPIHLVLGLSVFLPTIFVAVFFLMILVSLWQCSNTYKVAAFISEFHLTAQELSINIWSLWVGGIFIFISQTYPSSAVPTQMKSPAGYKSLFLHYYYLSKGGT